MSETEEKKGLWALIVGVFTVLTQLWVSVPEESRAKLIAAIADGFEGILRRFFRKYNGIEAEPGQEVTP